MSYLEDIIVFILIRIAQVRITAKLNKFTLILYDLFIRHISIKDKIKLLSLSFYL
jgi:hypothetical protein